MGTRTVGGRDDALAAIAEVFRERGFEGASLSAITERTGLGKGSLYHFFPGGKEEMAAAVLAEIDEWFTTEVFGPLRQGANPTRAIEQTFRAVDAYFCSGRRICLVGALALGGARDRFGAPIRSYFSGWTDALADALVRSGRDAASARSIAEETVGAIQGALVLARAVDDPTVFTRSLDRLRVRIETS